MTEHTTAAASLDDLQRFGQAVCQLVADLREQGAAAPIEIRASVSIQVAGRTSPTSLNVPDHEAAAQLGLDVDVVRGLVRCGALHGTSRHGGYAISRQSLERYQPGSEPDALLNATEAAARLGMVRSGLYRLRRQGRIEGRRLRNEVLFRLADVHRLQREAGGRLRTL